MTLKKIVWVSIGLFALFFFVGWIFTPSIMDFVVGHMKGVSRNLEIHSSSMSTQFRIHLYSALSFAVVPLMALASSFFIISVRKKYLTNWDYFFNLSILAVVYFVASVFKFYALEATIVKVLNTPIAPDVKNTLPINEILLYDWAFYASIITMILVSLLSKRKVKK